MPDERNLFCSTFLFLATVLSKIEDSVPCTFRILSGGGPEISPSYDRSSVSCVRIKAHERRVEGHSFCLKGKKKVQ